MSLLSRKHLLIALASGAMFVTACGDDETPPAGDTGGADAGDTDLDVTVQDTSDDAATCEDGAPVCTRNSDCAGSDLDNPVCDDGCCAEGAVTLDPCRAHLGACTSTDQNTDQYFCDVEAGLCLQICDSDTADDNQSADCPINSYCFENLTSSDPDALLGLCIPGDCETNTFDPDACGGVDTCLPVGNEASFCVTAGTVPEGGECGSNDDGTPLCGTGLRCVEGTCVAPCNRRDGDADCSEGETCVGAFDTTPRNQPGLCGVECSAFSTDECAEGEACNPVLGRFGINAWMCQAVPDGVTPVEPGGDCSADDAVCGAGYICLTTSDTTQECTQMCDPLGASAEPGASCGSASEAGDELFASVEALAASDYNNAAAGDVAAQVRLTADGALATTTTLVYAGDTVSSTVLTAGADDAVETFSITDWTAGDTLPTNGLRVVHGVFGADAVDVWLNYAPVDIAAGAPTYTEDFSADAEWTFGDLALGNEAGHTYTVFATPTGVTVTDDQPATLAADQAGVRFYNAGFGSTAVDIYFDCSAPSLVGTVADCEGDSPLVAGLAVGDFDDAGAFTAFGTSASGSTVYVIEAGADPVTSVVGSFATTIPALTDGDHVQLIVTAGIATIQGSFEPVQFPVEATDFSVAFTNFATTATTFSASMLFADDLAYGTGTEGEASFFTEIAEGDYTLSVGDFTSNEFSIEDAYPTAFLHATDDGIDAVLIDATLAPPATGEGAIRVVNIGGAAMLLTAPAESNEVCSPSALDGLGFCNEGCTPYPRGTGSYGCEEATDTCLPFVARDDRPVEPQGFCAEEEGTVAAGENCSNPGFLGGDCEDFAVCLELVEGGTAQCLPLCEPFAVGGCAAYDDFATCSGVPPLLGQLNFSFCIDAQAGAIGDRCSEEGTPCAADSSICLGEVCEAVCRIGFDDCAEGTECVGGQLNPDVVPTFMGLCE